MNIVRVHTRACARFMFPGIPVETSAGGPAAVPTICLPNFQISPFSSPVKTVVEGVLEVGEAKRLKLNHNG